MKNNCVWQTCLSKHNCFFMYWHFMPWPRELVLEVHIFHLAFFSQVEITRFELVTSCLQGRRSPNWAIPPNGLVVLAFSLYLKVGLSGPYLLSEGFGVSLYLKVGLSGLEPPTSRLSGVRSNRLSYKPILFFLIEFGSHLLSHIVSNAVPSAA